MFQIGGVWFGSNAAKDTKDIRPKALFSSGPPQRPEDRCRIRNDLVRTLSDEGSNDSLPPAPPENSPVAPVAPAQCESIKPKLFMSLLLNKPSPTVGEMTMTAVSSSQEHQPLELQSIKQVTTQLQNPEDEPTGTSHADTQKQVDGNLMEQSSCSELGDPQVLEDQQYSAVALPLMSMEPGPSSRPFEIEVSHTQATLRSYSSSNSPSSIRSCSSEEQLVPVTPPRLNLQLEQQHSEQFHTDQNTEVKAKKRDGIKEKRKMSMESWPAKRSRQEADLEKMEESVEQTMESPRLELQKENNLRQIRKPISKQVEKQKPSENPDNSKEPERLENPICQENLKGQENLEAPKSANGTRKSKRIRKDPKKTDRTINQGRSVRFLRGRRNLEDYWGYRKEERIDIADLQAGVYIACANRKTWYYGRVVEPQSDGVNVRVELAEPHGGSGMMSFYWPTTVSPLNDGWIPVDDILGIIPTPTLKANNQFGIPPEFTSFMAERFATHGTRKLP